MKLVAAGSIRHIPAETARTFAAWVADGGTLYLQAPGEWSDYSGGKLDLPAGFRKAVTAAGVARYGKGTVVTVPGWEGDAALMSGPVAWSGSTPNREVECRLPAAPDGTPQYLSIVNLKGKVQKVRLRDGRTPLRITGKDLWNHADAALDGEFELAPFEVRLIEVARP